ncbi:MAG TPA: purine-nucleoside phosphorylase, partial [Candidatus Marinimicrobia bacterium]|nr:purine-nucleoside phosphorylase [Candidatus Neomarinimicrobiota bacterium]
MWSISRAEWMNLNFITSHILNKIPEPPQTSVILGSGLGNFVDSLEKPIFIPYSEILGHPCSTVPGHEGEWVFGYINNKPILCASGRFHLYEGFNLDKVTLLVSVIHSLGCKSLIITNAAGCLKHDWQIGNFMLISGYLDYTYLNGSGPLSVVLFEEEQIIPNIKTIATKLGISLL